MARDPDGVRTQHSDSLLQSAVSTALSTPRPLVAPSWASATKRQEGGARSPAVRHAAQLSALNHSGTTLAGTCAIGARAMSETCSAAARSDLPSQRRPRRGKEYDKLVCESLDPARMRYWDLAFTTRMAAERPRPGGPLRLLVRLIHSLGPTRCCPSGFGISSAQ
jgi:hypothetical protein